MRIGSYEDLAIPALLASVHWEISFGSESVDSCSLRASAGSAFPADSASEVAPMTAASPHHLP